MSRFEILEDRVVLSAAWCVPAERTEFIARRWQATPAPAGEVLFAPGTPQQYIDSVEAQGNWEPPAAFTTQSRWSATATDGSGLSNGDVTTLTWSIAPDGTPIGAIGNKNGESAEDSNLIAYLRGIYNETDTDSDYTDEEWFAQLESAFGRWSELTGITYVYEPNDDGAEFRQLSFYSPGIIETRGDIRIGGHRIDGNGGTLAYNFYPNNGEMVIDTSDSYFSDKSSNSIRLRNAVAHEAGHGLGLRHSRSSDSRLLMEPIASTSFDGPQFDDILGAQWFYGDAFGDNDSITTAHDLGTVDVGETVAVGTDAADMLVLPTDTDFASIDSATEEDFYSFSVSQASNVRVTLSPLGPTYQYGPEGGPQTTFDAEAQSDLTLEIRDATSGTTVATANASELGESEVIEFSTLGAGTYVAIGSGLTVGVIQMYQLEVSVLAPPPPQVASVTVDEGSGQRSAIRSITVDFDTQVTVSEGAFVVAAADGSEVAVSHTLSLVDNKTRAVLTFSGPLVDASGSLRDGNYTLTLVDAKITDASGSVLDGDGDGVAGASRIDRFFRLYGDGDGDRDVDLVDFAVFRGGFGEPAGSPNDDAGMDQDGDGDIDLVDFAVFRSNFGTALPPAS